MSGNMGALSLKKYAESSALCWGKQRNTEWIILIKASGCMCGVSLMYTQAQVEPG